MPARERTLTTRNLNRALLARQMLLERGRTTLPRALERMGGLQAQYAPSMYIGLWSRVEGFERDQLTRALERRTVVQGTLMRTTIHLVSRRDYWPFAIAVRRARREWWLRVARDRAGTRALERGAERLRERLADGAMSHRDIEALLGRDVASGVGLWIDLVRIPPSGTWERRRADLFGAAERWVGPEPRLGEAEAIDHLVRRYLAAFGPAARDDVASFTGIPRRDVGASLDRLDLREFRSDAGAVLFDLRRVALASEETEAPVRFLPTFDAMLLAHARRTGILPEPYRAIVFDTRTPQSVPTFIVDGEVAGAWRHTDGRIELTPYRPLPRAAIRALREEADALAALHA